MWEDAKFGLRHQNGFEKIAVAGGPEWAAWGTKPVSHFVEGQVKIFAPEELPAAWEWLES